jgi:hypothetical protein
MTTFKAACLKRHELTSELDALRQCRSTLSEYSIKTTGVDSLIEAKNSEIESLMLDISDRKELLDKYKRVYFDRTTIELPREIGTLRHRVFDGQRVVERKRSTLVEAGIEADEAAKLFPDYDATSALQLLEPLEAEKAAWDTFYQTGLASDLPANADKHISRIGV